MSDADVVFVLLFGIVVFYVASLHLKIRRLKREVVDARVSSAPTPAAPLPVEASPEFQQLRQRVNVLERIAVEKEDTLSREIAELRDR